MRIFKRLLIGFYICIAGCCCHADESEGDVVKTCGTARGDTVSVFTYGIVSNRLDYVVLEVGQNQVVNHVEGRLTSQNDGNLKGIQYLKLDGLSVSLKSSHRLFIVDRQKCVTVPLTISLKVLEQSLKDRPQKLSEELQASLRDCFKIPTEPPAGLLPLTGVGSVLTARWGDARTSPPWPAPKSLAAGPL